MGVRSEIGDFDEIDKILMRAGGSEDTSDRGGAKAMRIRCLSRLCPFDEQSRASALNGWALVNLFNARATPKVEHCALRRDGAGPPIDTAARGGRHLAAAPSMLREAWMETSWCGLRAGKKKNTRLSPPCP